MWAGYYNKYMQHLASVNILHSILTPKCWGQTYIAMLKCIKKQIKIANQWNFHIPKHPEPWIRMHCLQRFGNFKISLFPLYSNLRLKHSFSRSLHCTAYVQLCVETGLIKLHTKSNILNSLLQFQMIHVMIIKEQFSVKVLMISNPCQAIVRLILYQYNLELMTCNVTVMINYKFWLYQCSEYPGL